MHGSEDQNQRHDAAAKWQSTFDAVSEAVCVLDLEGRVRQCNRSMLKLTGCSLDQIRVRACWELMHGTTERPADCPVNRMLETGEHGELALQWKGRHFEVRVDPMMDDRGVITGLVHVMRDVSSQKRAQEDVKKHMRELERSEQRFRRLYSQSPIGIEVYDAEGKLTDANSACLAIFGVTDVARVQGFDLFADPSIPAEAMDQLKKGHMVRFESGFDFGVVREKALYPTTRSGRIEIECQVSPLMSKSEHVEGYLVYVRDVTERRRAEREREAMLMRIEEAKKLESLSVLAGGVAHDFNNLLMGVLGNMEIALADLPEESPVREGMELGMEAARKAADLSRQMLAFSGKGRFVTEPMDLRQVANEAICHDVLSAQGPTNVTVCRRFSETVMPVLGDTDQVRELLCSLLANAREAMAGVGTLTVSVGDEDCAEHDLAGNRSQEALRAGRYVCVSVSDTGCGMDEETQEKLFDPFYSTKFVGRGLGLSVVLGIIRAYHGGIFIESEVGKGTTVRALFPTSSLAETETAAPETRAGEAEAEVHETVLLVDDEKQVRIVSGRILERGGFSVVTASDGLEALEILKRRGRGIGCVILDLSMPHLGGEPTYRRVRELGSDVPVILSSGYDEAEATRRFKAGELVGFLGKPYSQEELMRMVRQAMQMKPSGSE